MRCAVRPGAARASASAMCDLPIPGSPVSTTTQSFAPPLPCRQRRNSKLDLLFAADQRRQSGLVLSPRSGFPLPLVRTHVPGRYRLRPAFQRDRTKIAVIEMPASEPARALTDQHRTGLGQRLQAPGEVRCLTNDRLLLTGASPIRSSPTTTVPVAMPTRTCSAVPTSVCRPAYGFDQRQPCAHRLCGIIFVRAGDSRNRRGRRPPCIGRSCPGSGR